MSKTTDWILEREQNGDIEYNPDKAVYEELSQILKGKNNKTITEEHERVVRQKHRKLLGPS